MICSIHQRLHKSAVVCNDRIQLFDGSVYPTTPSPYSLIEAGSPISPKNTTAAPSLCLPNRFGCEPPRIKEQHEIFSRHKAVLDQTFCFLPCVFFHEDPFRAAHIKPYLKIGMRPVSFIKGMFLKLSLSIKMSFDEIRRHDRNASEHVRSSKADIVGNDPARRRTHHGRVLRASTCESSG